MTEKLYTADTIDDIARHFMNVANDLETKASKSKGFAKRELTT